MTSTDHELEFRSGLPWRLLGLAPCQQLHVGNTIRLQNRDGGHTHDLLRISATDVRRSYFWYGVGVTTLTGTYVPLLAGVSLKYAEQCRQTIEHHRAQIVEADRRERLNRLLPLLDQIRELYGLLETLMNGPGYISASELKAFMDGVDFAPVSVSVKTDDLDLPSGFRTAWGRLGDFAEQPQKWVAERNELFVKRVLEHATHLFDTIESNPLTMRQRLAVVRNEDRNLVVAGAGTGKTSVVAARVGYLVKELGVSPSEILVLAFARKAREELEERVRDRLGFDIEARTFHSLGLSIIGQATGRKPSLSKAAEDDKVLQERLGTHVDELLTDQAHAAKLMHFFANHLRPFKDERDFKTANEYYRYLQAQGIRSLKGELVKSFQEMQIANWFLLNGIAYEYETQYRPIDTADADHRAYEPDFHLPDHDIYVEHFGIGKRGGTAPFVDKKEYHRQMAWKRELHKKHGTTLIETYSYQFKDGNVFEKLKANLTEHDVETNPIPPDELKEILHECNMHTPFISLCATFLKLFKSSGMPLADLQKLAVNRDDQARCSAFLDVFALLCQRYEDELQNENAIDFEDMIQHATKLTRSGQYQSRFSHIIVDEFQDIAVGRANLVRALLDQVKHSRLLVVGDDWQSIFRFAGSDVAIMTNFEREFGTTCRTDLDRAFRYPDLLLEASSQFITENPGQLKKKLAANQSATEPVIHIRYANADEPESVLPRILDEIVADADDDSASVMVLGRYKFALPAGRRALARRYSNLEIEYRTVHRSKGLEADYVVVLDVTCGQFGFPSEVADDPLLELVLSDESDFANAEERRLFYVALTRAKRHVYLVTREASPSEFISELGEAIYEHCVDAPSTDFEPATCLECSGQLVQRQSEYGTFWGCFNYPYCRGKGIPCLKCGGALNRKRREYLCNRESCEFTAEVCPRCDKGYVIERNGPHGPFYGCSIYPKCGFKRKMR